MASGSAPCCGNVLKITNENFEDLAKKLNIDMEDFNEFITEHPDITYEDYLEELYWADESLKARVGDEIYEVDVIRYSSEDGDIYDDLEDGFYLFFDEPLLYIKEQTNLAKKLDSMGIFPEFSLWTQYG